MADVPEPSFLVYGANGFTGGLIAERARSRGLRPVLAGRNRQAVEAMGSRLGLPTRIFDLTSADAVVEGLRGVRLVLHCAGPYSRTSRPMVDACLRARVHYLDIAGELAVLEAVLGRDAEARAAGVVLLPAVGFDVVPTDCMAASLSAALPDATRLELAFAGGLRASPGTAKTTIENLHVGALVRENGAIVALRAPRTRELRFDADGLDGRPRFGMSIPWGDLVSAFHSTGIPNITVYIAVPPHVVRMTAMVRLCGPLLRMPIVVRFLQNTLGRRATGPSEGERKTGRMAIWGRVENAAGAAVEGRLDVPEGYELTVLAALESVDRVLRGDVKPGATTPSKAFGADFVTTLPGAGRIEVASATASR